MSRTVLLRLSDSGEPVNTELISNGVLILPAIALPDDLGSEPLFKLRFQINSAAKVSQRGILKTNVPPNGVEFERQTYYDYPLNGSFHKDISLNVNIYRSGCYNYYLEYQNKDELEYQDGDSLNDGPNTVSEKFYFNVPPNLTLSGKYVPFNNINVESVVSKWIGKASDWDSFFGKVADKGYNMIHFTPLQQRGESNSPYSIYDQLEFDNEIFKNNDEAKKTISTVLNKHNLLSLTDIVWNHTANNSAWLRDHPESGYTAETAPHLTAAIELDAKLFEFSSRLADLGYPTHITSSDQIEDIVRNGVTKYVLDELQLWQFYVFDKKHLLEEISCTPVTVHLPKNLNLGSSLKEVASFVLRAANQNASVILSTRYANKLDPPKVWAIVSQLYRTQNVDIILERASSIIDEINAPLYATYNEDLNSIKNQLIGRIQFCRLDSNGPRMGEINDKNPLAEPYFTRFTSQGVTHSLANNGWIWGGNPLVDFASSKSKAYLRREVIVWGDCVKLRYGNKIEDSPYLWSRMIEYTQLCASTFNGFRIDNCHSTPLHVGEVLLDAARAVNPDLYVVAELFSGSEEMDKIFVERLGINSLIREAMQAGNVAELSRLVHKHGGRPIGSLTWLPLDAFSYPATKEPTQNVITHSQIDIPQVLTNQPPHALFMDCTHDNETPNQKRTVEDTLPNAALVAFCSSAIGSVYGYDEIYPELLDVVGESRQYASSDNGIGSVKLKLHKIRKELAEETADILHDHEMYIHHEGEYITIQRHNARTGKGWFLVARTKFYQGDSHQTLSPCKLNGTFVKHQFSYALRKTGEYEYNPKYLTGVPVVVDELEQPYSEFINGETVIHIDSYKFPPGSITVFSTEIANADQRLDDFIKEGAIESTLDLNLYDLNAILYKCEQEERDASAGQAGVYSIPEVGTLVYAGFEGWNYIIRDVIWQNNLGHAFCNHLRSGDWALDYVVDRLTKYAEHSPAVATFQKWLGERIHAIKKVPYFLKPHYFALVLGIAYESCRFRALRQMSFEIQQGTNFIQRLALTSVQMVGKMNNTSLQALEKVPSLAAGLPHFSNDYMRSWGRDVFISFRGLLLVTERFEDAKLHILSFAQTLKHGLIPNLLDAGRNPRYNARDAVWFFLEAIQDYVKIAPNGIDILQERVKRRFPLDDTYVTWDSEEAFSYESSIEEVIYEIFSRHAAGIKYREANAGPNLDSQMKDNGFNVEVNIDWETGLVHGGSQDNCGTWMDKMGESEKAHSKGVPGTPRDGAAIELQGLLKSGLRFVVDLHKKGKFRHTEVKKADGTTISFDQWNTLLQDNFERCFFIPRDPQKDYKYDLDVNIINRRGIYKDLYKSGKAYEDYQLRPNFAIAMCVAPELFTVQRAYFALELSDQVIRGPVGMSTLDPLDYNYRPDYINGPDTDDFATSKGRNYHQGPEWVWCTGYFLRALLKFKQEYDAKSSRTSDEISQDLLCGLDSRLQGHVKWIQESPWAGLTELSNKNGSICYDLSPTQAWSSSCLLDLYYDVW